MILLWLGGCDCEKFLIGFAENPHAAILFAVPQDKDLDPGTDFQLWELHSLDTASEVNVV